MLRKLIYTALCALMVLTAASNATVAQNVAQNVAQDGKSVVSAAAKAMGAENLKTLALTGSGSIAGTGQNISPVSPWPLMKMQTYTRTLDLDTLSSNFEATGIVDKSETRQKQVTPANAPWANQFDIWVTTPYAFLKGAMANAVTLRSEVVNEVRYRVVTFTLQGKYKVEGYITDNNTVERTRTWVDNDVMGDMLVEGIYSDYKDFAGLKVPTLTIVKQGGFPTLIAGVLDAKVNTPVAIPVAPAQAASAAVTVEAEKVAEGVYFLKGGSHHSVLVEFADHVTLIEAPLNEVRSLALLAKVKELYPNKPLTQVVNTHHHFDHAGGLRTFVDAGAAIFTSEADKPFFEKTFKAPRTLSPDRLEVSKRAAVITAVGEKLVLSDAVRTVELHTLRNNAHAEGMLVAFLPKEKLLVEVDMYTPPAPNAPPPAADVPVNANAVALLDNLERLRLDFDTILPLHGTTKATRADLYQFTKKPLVPVSSLADPAAGGGRGGRGGAGGGGGRGGAAGGGAGRGAAPAPTTPAGPAAPPLPTP